MSVNSETDTEVEVSQFLTDHELELDEAELNQIIQEEEKRGRLLEQQNKLAIIRQNNAKHVKDLRKLKSSCGSESRVVVDEEAVNHLPSLSEASGRPLPTLGDLGGPTQSTTRIATIPEEVPLLSTLRSQPGLRLQVDNQLAELDPWRLQQGQQGTGRLQSGRVAKSDSGVIRLIVWPHTWVFTKLGASLSYDKLDLASLVVGELTIINDPATSDSERKARILQLIRVCNYSRSFEWPLVREFHAAYLSAIERSLTGDWLGVDVNDIAAQVLFLVPRNSVVPPRNSVVAPVLYQQQGGPGGAQGGAQGRGKKQRRFFCSAWNKGTCPHAGSHKAVVAGRLRDVDHVCATCLLYFDEYQAHPEIECPRRNNNNGNNNNNNNGGNNGLQGGDIVGH